MAAQAGQMLFCQAAFLALCPNTPRENSSAPLPSTLCSHSHFPRGSLMVRQEPRHYPTPLNFRAGSSTDSRGAAVSREDPRAASPCRQRLQIHPEPSAGGAIPSRWDSASATCREPQEQTSLVWGKKTTNKNKERKNKGEKEKGD